MKLIIILFLSSFSLMANSQNDRFDSKVKYEYNVYLEVLNLKLGEASLSVKAPGNIDGINVYGAYNEQRLTGLHETASIHDFSYGVSDRGASIRIPIITVENGWKGWLEDRRPASNGDPYKIAGRIIETVKSAKL